MSSVVRVMVVGLRRSIVLEFCGEGGRREGVEGEGVRWRVGTWGWRVVGGGRSRGRRQEVGRGVIYCNLRE